MTDTPDDTGLVWAITDYDEWGDPIYGYIPADVADHYRADIWHPNP